MIELKRAIRLQLCKPVTWIPLVWGVACGTYRYFILAFSWYRRKRLNFADILHSTTIGAAASGNYHTWYPFSDGSIPTRVYAEDALKGQLSYFKLMRICRHFYERLFCYKS